MEKVSVIGAGGWGTTLAILLSHSCKVLLWERFPEYAEILRTKRENPDFLSGIPLPEKIDISLSLEEAFSTSSLLLLAVPSSHVGTVLSEAKQWYRGQPLLIATKGLDMKTEQTISSLVIDILKEPLVAVLSGPTIAREVAEGKPTAAVVASDSLKVGETFQKLLSSEVLRIYLNTDIRGVELAGAYKNVIAIGAGIVDGLNLGINTKSSYLTRGIEEMKNLGYALGGKERTFWGLAGIGDVMTTSFSPLSRNRSYGEAVARGRGQQFLSSTKMVVEGLPAARVFSRLGKRNKVQLPLSEAVVRIVDQLYDPHTAIRELMARSLKHE
ncbi:MAG: NAD(P)H-dependent glycerol-3-phosphate dehydrogenase [Candidatus Ratteibacteria bacterium]|jgi:glycerol-3-phosphate dehydrogenase (NAD(P)+)